MTALLVAEDLRKSFGATPALDGASLEVDAGEVVAVMGPSGSGLAFGAVITLLSLPPLWRLMRPDGLRTE